MGKGDSFLKEHFISFLVLIFVIMIALMIMNQLKMKEKVIRLTALEHAEAYLQAIESFRTLYTAKVVLPMRSKGVEVIHDYAQKKGAIPLPATLSMELAKHIGQHGKGSTTRLYSDYPFPWRETGGPQDSFERKALKVFQNNSNDAYHEFVDYRGVPSLRYARADIMRPACVSCHNTHPQSPKRDWKVGDVRGALVVTVPLDKVNLISMEAIRENLSLLVILGSFLAFLLYHVANRVHSGSDGTT